MAKLFGPPASVPALADEDFLIVKLEEVVVHTFCDADVSQELSLHVLDMLDRKLIRNLPRLLVAKKYVLIL